jgi:hypothetical protein
MAQSTVQKILYPSKFFCQNYASSREEVFSGSSAKHGCSCCPFQNCPGNATAAFASTRSDFPSSRRHDMSRKFLCCAGAGLILIVVFVGVLIRISAQVPPEAIALRERFPYRSLASRLEFDAPDAARDSAMSPALPEAGLERLNKIELVFDSGDSQARLLSLQKLHSREVAYFISRPGNGLSRMGRLPGRDLLEYSEPPPLPVMAESNDSGSGQSADTLRLEDRPVGSIPSADELENFHRAGQIAFADPWTLGDVKSRDQVAGFISHGFTYMPVVGDPWNQYPHAYDPSAEREAKHSSDWTIIRLELVSLLKFDSPAVYVTGFLPRMKDLADAPTRPLTAFEQQSLESLRAGEDLVTVVDTNDIQMLGSLRAVKQCLGCHSGERGRLLGAFSYRLRRDPPLPDHSSGRKPET